MVVAYCLSELRIIEKIAQQQKNRQWAERETIDLSPHGSRKLTEWFK